MRDVRRLVSLREISPVFVAALILITLALLFGGASRENPVGLMVVELAGLGASIAAVLRLYRLQRPPLTLAALGLLALLFAIPILQSAPLPPSLWMNLPGRAPLVRAASVIGLPAEWRPMSLAPDDTGRAVLFLLAPAGMFIAALQCDVRQRMGLIGAVLLIALASLIVGGLQVAGGNSTPLHFFDASAAGLPSGFFVNRNHQAAFMVAAMALAAGFAASSWAPAGLNRWHAFAFVLMPLFAVGAAATLSRAGILLAGPVMVGGVLLFRPSGKTLGRIGPLILVLIAVVSVIAMIYALKGGVIFDRFENGEAGGGRLGLLPDVIAIGDTLQPWGGGIGSFDLAYRATERLEQIDPFFLNHVHNDYVELWLEAGWPAILALLGFAVWWARAAMLSWRDRGRPGAALAQSATLVTGALLVHSAIDYPLRTPALAVLFSLACALMLDPPQPKTVAAVNVDLADRQAVESQTTAVA